MSPIYGYPTDVLRAKIVETTTEPEAYKLDDGRFTIIATTPVLVGRLQVYDDMQQAANRYMRRGKKIKDTTFNPVDEPFYEWYRNASGLLDSMVTFEVKPDFGQTAGSMWMSAHAGAAAGVSGTYAAPTHQTLEFKAEFQELRLYRDGKLMTPVTPGRMITE